MMVRRSEYTKQFTKSNLEKNLPNYYSYVNYRLARREQEHSHTSLSWDSDSDKDSAVTDRNSTDTVCSLSVECSSLLLNENEDRYSDVCKNDIGHSAKSKHKRVQTDEINQSDDGCNKNRPVSKYAQCELNKKSRNRKNIDSQKAKSILKPEKVSDKTFMKSKQPRRDNRFRKLPKPRPFSAPTGRPIKKEENPPFLAYGLSDRELMVGNKRTHNVRASQAVYPAALRAQKRREVDILQREEEMHRQTYRDQKYKTLFMDKMARETSGWISEYQRSFPGYSSVEYSRSFSSRRNYDKC